MPNYTFNMLDNGKMPEGMKATLSNVLPTYAGKKIRMSIGEAKEKRSLDQNSYYWAAVVPHIRNARFETGDPLTMEQVHEDLLSQFAPLVTVRLLDGTTRTRPMRSKEMSVEQMANYITAITAYMVAYGNPIKEPKDE